MLPPQAALERWMSVWQDITVPCPARAGGVCYSPAGLAHYSVWGNLHEVGNAGLVAALYANGLTMGPEARGHRCWARSQLLRMAGGLGFSYVIGWVQRQWLKAVQASGDWLPAWCAVIGCSARS